MYKAMGFIPAIKLINWLLTFVQNFKLVVPVFNLRAKLSLIFKKFLNKVWRTRVVKINKTM